MHEFSYNMIQLLPNISDPLNGMSSIPSLRFDAKDLMVLGSSFFLTFYTAIFHLQTLFSIAICNIYYSKLLHGTHPTIVTLSVLALVCRTAFRMWNNQSRVVQQPPYIFLGSFQCSKKSMHEVLL
jgi:hypothetical protein